MGRHAIDIGRHDHTGNRGAGDAAQRFAQCQHLTLRGIQRLFDIMPVARGLGAKLRTMAHHCLACPLAAHAAAHAIAYDEYAMPGQGIVLIAGATQSDIAVQAGHDTICVHELRPFPCRRMWNTSASDSLALHLRAGGRDPSMDRRTTSMFRQYRCTCSSCTVSPENAA